MNDDRYTFLVVVVVAVVVIVVVVVELLRQESEEKSLKTENDLWSRGDEEKRRERT